MRKKLRQISGNTQHQPFYFRLQQQMKRNYKAYLFLLPIFALILTFSYYPFFVAVFRSFYRWNGANLDYFNGINNFKALFNDPVFIHALRNVGLIMIAQVFIVLLTPFLVAELVFNLKTEKYKTFYKISFVVPMVVPFMIIILIWRWMYSSEHGIINQFLELINLGHFRQPWLGQTKTALISVIFVNFPWVGGIPFLLYLAGLQNIPSDLFECGQLDGINPLQRFVHIDVPLIKNQIKIVLMLEIIKAAQTFQQAFVLTRGGPGTSTMTPALYLYEQGFVFSRFGKASAVGVVIFVGIMILAVVNQKFIKNSEKMN